MEGYSTHNQPEEHPRFARLRHHGGEPVPWRVVGLRSSFVQELPVRQSPARAVWQER